MNTQRRLVELHAQEANIRTTLVSMQKNLLPTLEIMKKELAIIKALMIEDANISTKEGMVDFSTRIQVQIKSLEIANNTWILEKSTIIQLC